MVADPDCWTTRSLGDIISFASGFAFPERFQGRTDGGLPFFKVSDMSAAGNERSLACAYNYVDRDLADRQKWKAVPVGAVAFAKVGAALLLNRRRMLPQESLLDNNMLAAVAGPHVDRSWLYWWLQTIDFGLFVQPGAVPSVNQAQIGSLRVSLPPIIEQIRMVEVLNVIDEALVKVEQLVAKLKQMKQGLLHDLLTRGIDENGELRDPERRAEDFCASPWGRIPRSWGVSPLAAIADIIDPNPSHRYPAEVLSGVPIAATENFVGENGYDLSFSKRVPESVYLEQERRCVFHPEDVVFARKGRIGFARPYGHEQKVFSHTVVLMKPKAGQCVHRFLLWSVRAERFFDGIRARMNSNVGVPTLGVGFLGRVPVAVPPLCEQECIAQMIDGIEKRINAEAAESLKLRLLKQGLMDDLLTGRVRVTPLLAEAIP